MANRPVETKLLRQLTKSKNAHQWANIRGLRRALLIGCQNYQHFPKLEHALDDIDDLAECLKSLKFEVMVHKNVTRMQAKYIISQFSERISQKDLTLFFFAGHATQIAGKNWLAMVDSKEIDRGLDLEEHVIDPMTATNFRHTLAVMLDACRTDFPGALTMHADTPADDARRLLLFPEASDVAWKDNLQMTKLSKFRNLVPDLHILYSLKPSTDHSIELQNGALTTAILMHISQRRISVQQCYSQICASAEVISKKTSSIWTCTCSMQNSEPLPVCLAGGSVARQDKPVTNSQKTVRKSALPQMAISFKDVSEDVGEGNIYTPEIDAFLQDRVLLTRKDMKNLFNVGFISIHMLRVALPAHLAAAGLSQEHSKRYMNLVPLFAGSYVGLAAGDSEQQVEKRTYPVLLKIRNGEADLIFLQLALRAYINIEPVVQACAECMISMFKKSAISSNALSQLEAARLGCLKDVMNTMNANPKVVVLQTRLCQLIRAIVTESRENQLLAAEIRLLETLQATLQEHSHSLAVMTRCCQAILAVCVGSSENQHIVVQTGLLTDLESLLVIHATDERMSLHICNILQHSVHLLRHVYDRKDNLTTLDQEETLEELISNLYKALALTMNEHAQSPDVVMSAISSIRSLVTTEKAEGIAHGLNMLQHIQYAMKNHINNPEIQAEACCAISNLVSSLIESRIQGHEIGILEAIHNAMREHPNSISVQEQAVWALLNFTHNAPGIQADAAKRGMLTDINQAMQNPEVSLATKMPEACWALIRNITHNSKAAQMQASRIGLTRWQQDSSAKMQYQGKSGIDQVCWTLKNISTAMDLSTMKAELLLDKLSVTMLEWKASAIVQEQACSALWSLLVITNGMKELHHQHAGFVTSLKTAMETHSAHSGVLIQAAWALSQLARSSTMACMEAARHGMVEQLDTLLKSHYDEKLVAEAACIALRSVLQGQDFEQIANYMRIKIPVRKGIVIAVMSNVFTALVANTNVKLVVESCLWILRRLTEVNVQASMEKVTEVACLHLTRLRGVIRGYLDNSEVQEHMCGFLWNLARNRKLEDGVGATHHMKVIIGNIGSISDIQVAMRTHRSNLPVQMQAVGALECLTYDNPPNLSQAISLHLVVEITAAIARHGATTHEFHSQAHRLLDRLRGQKEHGRAGKHIRRDPSRMSFYGLTWAKLSAMNSNNADREVNQSRSKQPSGTGEGMFDVVNDTALQKQVQNKKSLRRRFSQYKDLGKVRQQPSINNLLLNYMPPQLSLESTRPKSAGTAEGMQNSLGEASDEAFLKKIAQSRDILYMQQMMRAHKQDAAVQQAALAALSSCISSDKKARKYAREMEMLEDVLNAMVGHELEGALQENGCRAMKYLIEGKDGKELSGLDEVMPTIVSALNNFRESIPVLVQGMLALTVQIRGDDNEKARLTTEFGALKILQAALKTFQFSNALVESSLSLLDELLKANAVTLQEQTILNMRRIDLITDVRISALAHENSIAINRIAMRILRVGRFRRNADKGRREGAADKSGGNPSSKASARDELDEDYDEPHRHGTETGEDEKIMNALETMKSNRESNNNSSKENGTNRGNRRGRRKAPSKRKSMTKK